MELLSAFKDEAYDDAFLDEVTQREVEALSPACSPSLAFAGKERVVDFGWKHSQQREGLPAKKLVFPPIEHEDFNFTRSNSGHIPSDNREREIENWYFDLIQQGHPSYATRPSLEILKAHGALSQEKSLLILTHFPRGGWERALSVDELQRYKECSIDEVDGRVCQHAQYYNKASIKKVAKTDWSRLKGNHMVFHCEVSSEGPHVFKGPFFEPSGSPIQRVFGDAGVLRVHFMESKNDEAGKGLYRKIAREGLWVGLRHYTFFAFKDPKAKKKNSLIEDTSSLPKCFFVCTSSFAEYDINNPKFCQFGSNNAACRYLMHIENVGTLSKRFARLQLALSQTLPILDLNDPTVRVEVIDDIYCRDIKGNIVRGLDGEPLIHTDGTGFVSKDIADRCPEAVFKGRAMEPNDNECPLLLQVRVFYKGMVAKGTLLLNLKLPPSTIQLRQSMVKVKSSGGEGEADQYNSLELCTTSRKPMKAKIFRHLVLLLSYGGVPEQIFLNLLHDDIVDIMARFKHRISALSVLQNSDQFDITEFPIRMLAAGMPMEEPYLQKTLWDMTKGSLEDLGKARISIPNTYNLMGCADPTGMLKRNQVVVILDNGPVYSPKVLIYKAPGLHVGDVKVFEATWYKEYEEFIGNGKYVVFFSTQGPRSVVDEIANSDLDGDQYWICTNPLVVENFRSSEVWQKPNMKSINLRNIFFGSDEDFNRFHFEAYLRVRFKPSTAMGSAANNWLARMDRFLMLDNNCRVDKLEAWHRIESLINTYYEAVDAEKTGNQVSVKHQDLTPYRPHYMKEDKHERERWIKDEFYISKSILGKIYDYMKQHYETSDCTSALERMSQEDTFIEKRFCYEGYKDYWNVWEEHIREYNRLTTLYLKDECEGRTSQIESLIEEYRKKLYKADTLSESEEPLDIIYKQASAIYIIVYNRANWLLQQRGREISLPLQFAWKVAGYALIQMYLMKEKRREPLLFDESVLRQLKFYKRNRHEPDS